MIELLTESKKTGAQCWCLIGVRIVDNCLHCTHWRLWELNQAGQRVMQKMAQHGFGECTARQHAGSYLPPYRDCSINKFEPVEPEQMHKRKLWLAKQETGE